MRIGHFAGDLIFSADVADRNPPTIRFTSGGPKTTTADLLSEFGPSLSRTQISKLRMENAKLWAACVRADGELGLLVSFLDFREGKTKAAAKKKARRKRGALNTNSAEALMEGGLDHTVEENYTGEGFELGSPTEVEITLT